MTPLARPQRQHFAWPRRFLGCSVLDHFGACFQGRLVPNRDWVHLVAFCNTHLVSPTLYRHMVETRGSMQYDDELLEYLGEIASANKERNLRILGQISEISLVAAEIGLDVIAIKGAATLVRAGGLEVSSRMLHDVDLLISERDIEAMAGMLRVLGYQAFPGSAFDHSSGSYFRKSDVASVDVHFRLPARFRKIVSNEDLKERTIFGSIDGKRIRIPDPSLQFVINIAHEMLHDRGLFSGFMDLRYVLELIDLSADESDPLDLKWIEKKAIDPRFRLSLELQSRMAQDLAGRPALPFSRRTALGRFLHERRRAKVRFETLGRWEWQAIDAFRRFRKLLRVA